MPKEKPPITPCRVSEEFQRSVTEYAEALKACGHTIGTHGLSQGAFVASGIFEAAIERLRGQRAATTEVKKQFIRQVLDYMAAKGKIVSWSFEGTGERFDYRIELRDRICIAEAKGCLDGNNTNIYQRPQSADEFIIWSLCQNPGADPRHNAWSGIHTRIGAEIISRRERVDAIVIWDMLCGAARPCPKLLEAPERAVILHDGRKAPPPCIYVMPRTIPAPEDNPKPSTWSLNDLRFPKALAETFGCRAEEITYVSIEIRQLEKGRQERRTTFVRGDAVIATSGWTPIKRVR